MMRKLLLMGCIAILGLTSSYGQNNFSIGAHAGIPVGDIDEISSFAANVDLAYRFSLVDIVEVGPLAGYYHFFGKDDIEDLNYVPLAASGRLSFTDSFFAGFDIGYAIALKENVDGGLFYRPQVGYGFTGFGLVLSYAGIAEGAADFGAVSLGLEFQL